MAKANPQHFHTGALGGFINRVQTSFVSLLRIWTIPIVLMLSVASGFTTYYGMKHFITPWIALIITIAVQSIVVICSLEMAGIHYKANRIRYLSVVISLFIAIATSISFSYFQFYEISEHDSIQIRRLNQVRNDVNGYLNKLVASKAELLALKRKELDEASKELSQAYFGTHPLIVSNKHLVGEGPFWKHYNEIYQAKKQQVLELEQTFSEVDGEIRGLQASLSQLGLEGDKQQSYQAVVDHLNEVQIKFSRVAASQGQASPEPPVLMAYGQFVENIKPSFAMWEGFSWFAFCCAAIVDFFTVLLSYRLEFTAPGPLTEREQDLVFECIRQFTEFRINENDELEMVIEKSELERARRYSDWSRMFAVGFLLSRGFLRKVDARTVEFAPNLYPLVAERMSDKLEALKSAQHRSVGG